jgi:transcriptional regulator with XRE-family HTH domain
MGKIVGVDSSTIGEWESSKSKPIENTLKKIEILLA